MTKKKFKLSIIIPTYNEEGTIVKIIRKIGKVKFPIDHEIILVNDGSEDETYAIEQRLLKKDKKHIKLFSHRFRKGKGASIRTGLKFAEGNIVIIQDADLEYNPGEIPLLIKPIISGKADIVYGSRFLDCYWPKNMAIANWICNKLLVFISNLLFGLRITDEATCYKVFRTNVLKSMWLKCKHFEFCSEVTAKAGKQKIRLIELPISYHGRSRKDGKKVNWRDALDAFWTLFKYRFVN